MTIVLCQNEISTFSCLRYSRPKIPSVLIGNLGVTTWNVMMEFASSSFVVPRVEIPIGVILIISMASCSETITSSSKASNFIIFMSAPVSTKNAALTLLKVGDGNSTTGDSRLFFAKRILRSALGFLHLSDVLFSPCPSLRRVGAASGMGV